MRLAGHRFGFVLTLFLTLVFLSACDKEAPDKKAAGVGEVVAWESLPGWNEDKHAQAWPALLQSCNVMRFRQKRWVAICDDAKKLQNPSNSEAKAFFEKWFEARIVRNQKGTADGLITGYYEPILMGSLTKSKEYPYPIYKWPKDLLIVDLGELYPDLKGRRLRGRVVGRKVVPYYSHADIGKDPNLLKGNELVWVKDPYKLFFLHIQGSGRIKLSDSEYMSVGYDQQNGHPYVAIGAVLIQRGEIARKDVSLETILQWLKDNPKKAFELMYQNPSFVFFRKLDKSLPGPLGALGVPLTAERSIAVDRKTIKLGNPVWLVTTLPNKPSKPDPTNPNAEAPPEQPYRRLVFAQDVGGAIRGEVRADVFWGNGQRAEFYAGHMKQRGNLYVLLPKPQPELQAPAEAATP